MQRLQTTAKHILVAFLTTIGSCTAVADQEAIIIQAEEQSTPIEAAIEAEGTASQELPTPAEVRSGVKTPQRAVLFDSWQPGDPVASPTPGNPQTSRPNAQDALFHKSAVETAVPSQEGPGGSSPRPKEGVTDFKTTIKEMESTFAVIEPWINNWDVLVACIMLLALANFIKNKKKRLDTL